jgi:hypothetical protein
MMEKAAFSCQLLLEEAGNEGSFEFGIRNPFLLSC